MFSINGKNREIGFFNDNNKQMSNLKKYISPFKKKYICFFVANISLKVDPDV